MYLYVSPRIHVNLFAPHKKQRKEVEYEGGNRLTTSQGNQSYFSYGKL